MNEYELLEEVVTVDEFIRLRKVSGLSSRPSAQVSQGLANSLYGVKIVIENHTVGMGRIIGDGALNFDIVDVAVDPEHQGKGLGRMVMTALMSYLKSNAAKGAYLSLMADVPELYKKFGFKLSSPNTEGMHYDWD